MNGRPAIPSDAELNRLLRDCGERIDYPPTPDVVDAALRRLDRAPRSEETRPPGDSWSDADPLLAPNFLRQADAGTLLDDLPGRRRGLRGWAGQALKLAAAILAFATVAALLALIFRGFGDDGQPAIAPPGEPETVTQQRLYVVSDVYGAEEGGSVEVHGRVTAYDAETGEELYAIDTGSQVEAVLSSDGSRLFVADISGGGDGLIALDAATGLELWRTTIQDRVHWIMGLGPSTIAVSPDNQRLFVYSSDASGVYGDARLIPYRIQLFDAGTGDWLTDIDIAYCPARLHASPDGKTLYMICHESIGPSSVIDLETGEPVDGIELSLAANGTAVSPDGHLLYIVSGGRATVIDMNERMVVERVPLELDTSPARLLRLVSLSPDGTRLFVGLGTDVDPDTSAVSSREIAVFDTGTWQETGRITTGEMPVNGQTMAGAPDNRSVFAVHNAFREGTSIPTMASILKLSPDAEPAIFATREREEVLAVFTGQVEVPVMPEPTAAPTITDEPEAGTQINLPQVALVSSSQRRVALVRAAASPPITQEEAMQAVDAAGFPWGLGGEWEGKPVTVDAWYDLATIEGHMVDSWAWILDYGNVQGTIGSGCPDCPPPPEYSHNVYAVDAETREVLFIGSY